MWVLIAPLLLAAPPSGSTVLGAGGSLGGVFETSVMGLHVNPASAYGKGLEVKFDVGLLMYYVGSDLVGPEQEPFLQDYVDRYGELPKGFSQIKGSLRSGGQFPIGSIGLSFPIGPVSIGLETFVPHGTGAKLDPDGPQRYISTGGMAVLVEQDVALATQIPILASKLTIGAALRGGYSQFLSEGAEDTGKLIYHISEGEIDEFVLDPALEGTKSFEGAAYTMGYALGAHWAFPHFSLHATYRSPMRFDVKGQYEGNLATVLDISIKGDAEAVITYPAEVYIGATIPIRRWQIYLEGGWVDWSTWRYLQGTASNLQLQSESAVFQSLIALYAEEYEEELTESVTGEQEFFSDSGNGDVFVGKVAARLPLSKKLKMQPSVAYSNASVPVEYSTLVNGDYATTDLGVNFLWQPNAKVTLVLSGNYLLRLPKKVTDSVYSYTNPPESGLSSFSGEGTYFFHMGRLGLTTHIRL